MNRLWVRLSLVIVLVVAFMAITPLAFRLLDAPPNFPRPKPSEITGEEFENYQISIERRLWRNISRTMLVGSILALAAGVIISRWLVSPLNRLEEGAKAVAENRLAYRVPEIGSREMRSVAISFNQMADNLEGQEKLRQNLLADVTHELRHPVHILQGNLRAILDGVFPLDRVEIARLLDQTDQLTILVDDLHQLALAESQQLPLNKRETNLTSLVSDSIEVSKPMFASKDIHTRVDLPSKAVVREVDEFRIRQAFQNILTNAYHYTPDGGEIEIYLSEGDKGVQISVKDSGIGISQEQLMHVFDRFYQADTSRDRGNKGIGLGLAIAKAIIQAHGGDIVAASSGQGQGSTFLISIP